MTVKSRALLSVDGSSEDPPTDQDVTAFLDVVDCPRRRGEGHLLPAMMERVTRRPAVTIYGIHNGYEPIHPLLAHLGPHTTGKSCVYVKRLDDIDLTVLKRLVRQT